MLPILKPKLKRRLPLKFFSRHHLPFALFLLIFTGLGAYYLVNSFAASSPDIYIAQAATGSANGTDCADAYPVSFFNTSSNWGTSSGQIGPGTTVHLCGTFTGAAGSTMLSFQGGGAAGNPVTVKFEPGSSLQAPYWGDAINLNGNSNITIDGGATGSIGGVNGNAANTNGFIENTLDGTPGGTCPGGPCAYQADSGGIISNYAVKNITIKNLAIINLYVRTSSTDESGQYGAGVSFGDWTAGGTSNILVTNCLMHDMGIGLSISYGAGDGPIEYSYNTVYNVNWGGNAGDRTSSSSLTGLVVHDNWFHDFSNWNDTVGDNYHHNGFYAWTAQGGSLVDPIFYNNKVGPGFGGQYQTTGLWAGGTTGATFFNNHIVTNPGDGVANGFLQANPGASGGTFYFANNTLNAQGGIMIMVSSSVSNAVFNISNNLATATSGGAEIVFANYFTAGTVNSNHNLYYNFGSTPFQVNTNGTGGFTNLAGWQAATGAANDSNDITSNPMLAASDSLQSGSPAIGAGTNLASLCSGQPNPGLGALCYDINSSARPATGAWDIGAYQYASAVSTDLNSDGTTNIFDLSIFLDHLGQTGTNLPGDFNADGKVDSSDLTTLQGNWGR